MTVSGLTYPADRLRGYLRAVRQLLTETREEVHASRVDLGAWMNHLETVTSAQLAQLAAQAEASAAARGREHEQTIEVLRSIHGAAAQRRALLRRLREDDDYALAYSDPEPLVSVVIPTYDNHELLRTRAIPSVLAQSYQNFEIVVCGDAASPQAREAVESFGDPRITFINRLYRGPYPADPGRRWLVAGVPPYNEAVRRARGQWIAPLDDDDAFRPYHLERVLSHAREERLELCYGLICAHWRDGRTATIGRFPPDHAEFGLQSALYHAGLADIFELELADAALDLPYDWGLCLRMMEADVRIGMVDEETTDYYPSRQWTPRWTEELGAPESPEWEYVPEGFARARSDDGQAAAGWQADEVARAYREKWPRFLEAVDGNGPLGVGHEVRTGAPVERTDVLAQNTVLGYAYALARARDGARPLSVLDYGGALGHYYVLARRLFPELELEYHCREVPAVCQAGREVLPEVSFHCTDDCLRRRYDLVMASASLQYAEDWPRLLSALACATARKLFLTRVPLVAGHPSFVVLQRAHAYGYATEYVGWVFNRDELLAAAQNAGLRLEREMVLLDEIAFEGVPAPFTHGGFLFDREDRD